MAERPPARPMAVAERLLARPVAAAIVLFARLVTAVRGVWAGSTPDGTRRVYFANHSSHGDFVLLWTVLPPRLRARTRPVAAADYWLASALRRFIGRDVFRALLIERTDGTGDPVAAMAAALDADSLILFPEGTRNAGDATLLPFRSGLFHLARARPDVDLVPVWIDNLNRVLPKGEIVPIPLVCTVTFGAALERVPDESKASFLARAEGALLALASEEETPNGTTTRAPGIDGTSAAANGLTDGGPAERRDAGDATIPGEPGGRP